MNAGAAGRAVFRIRDFRLYVQARCLWQMAIQIQTVAVAWLVYERTSDARALGLLGLAAFLPSVPLSLVTGAVADRYDRRRVMLVGYGVMAACGLGLVFATRLDVVWPIYVLVLISGGARAFANPAGQALMARLTPPAHYASATAWNNSFTQAATVVGPALGGLLFPLGALAPFLAALAMYGAAAATVFLIAPVAPAPERRAALTLKSLVAGYGFIWRHPVILGALTLDLVAVLLGGATALLPIFARDVFQVGPWGLGLLRSAPAVGSIVMALALANFPLSRRVGVTMFAAVAIYGVATVGFGLTQNFIVAMACLAILGAADTASVVIRLSLIQLETPDAMRGRVNAVLTIVTGASNNLGDFESGMLAWAIGAAPAVVLGGLCAIGAAAGWMRLFPALRARDQLEPQPRTMGPLGA